MMKIVLLDRDGTIIQEPVDERVTSEGKIELFDNSVSALKKLADAGFEAIIITNQAGISEGRITVEEFERIHAEVLRQLAPSGLKILKTFMCPHVQSDNCECRKPKPTMLLKAAREFDLDLSSTYMIGDHESDVLAAKNAGAKGVLVRTARNHQDESAEADYTANNLAKAVDFIIDKG